MPLDIVRIRAAFPGRRIDYYRSIDSTMRAAAGLETGAVVLAEEQTAGQGRLGRAWHSQAGAGVYCSIVLKPAPLLTLALGLAARGAILEAAGLTCDLRWPNDLMLADKKVGGILVRTAGGHAVAGIGINVDQTAFPPEIASEATSLRLQWGGPPGLLGRARGPRSFMKNADRGSPVRSRGVGLRPAMPAFLRASVGREDAARNGGMASRRLAPRTDADTHAGSSTLPSSTDVLLALLPAVDSFVHLDPAAILRLFAEASSYASGRRVIVRQSDAAIEGTTAGLALSGFLIVRKDDGTDTLVLAGGVRAAGS